MKSVLLLIALFAAIISATTHYNTNNRQVYSSWSVCSACKCEYFTLYATEHTTQNPSDTTPPVYLYYYHSTYDSCLNTYSTEWLQITTSLPGLEISRSGRTAELSASNLTDSASQSVSFSLSWSSKDSDNTNNCNCRNIYSYGAETLKINTKSSYRNADLTGTVTINGVVHTVPADTYSFISGYGQKTLTSQH